MYKTLYFLLHFLLFSISGDGYRTLRQQYRVGLITVGKIITDTCDAIYQALQPEYLVVIINQRFLFMSLSDVHLI